jgi:hypothetical protein
MTVADAVDNQAVRAPGAQARCANECPGVYNSCMTETRSTCRLARLLRLPSFGVALTVSLSVLVAFAVWMFVDASFPITAEVAAIDVKLQEDPGMDMAEMHGWNELGPRLMLFASLASVGLLSTLLLFYRSVFGSRQGRSIRSLFVVVALVGLWLAIGLSHESIESAGFRWRMHRTVQGLKQDAQILSTAWPTTDGVLPYLGQYTVDDENPQFIVLRSERVIYSAAEGIGPFVIRTENGAIMFNYMCDNCGKIEFHPNGDKPANYTQIVWEEGHQVFRMMWIVDEVIELEPNWYYVTYLPEWAQDAGKEPTQ